MKVLCLLLVLVLRGAVTAAQDVSVTVEVKSADAPVADADVTINGVAHRTDAQGAVITTASPGLLEVVVQKEGFAPASTSFQIAAGQERRVLVELTPTPAVEEQITVSATRTDRRLEDQPMRVEVLAREEIEEKMLMTPGDIVMMLNEMGGLRVQTTSPSLGAASVRMQGMRGRYTRFLFDGLPLFGEQVGGLGLLQIPPMDLAQVEVIKGVASALHGAGAMGGVVNLISRRPGAEPVREVLLNRSTRGATDAVIFLSAPLSQRWSASVLGGGHWQQQSDLDDDGWADLAGYDRAVVRPRLFWDGGDGRSLFATTGVTFEDRDGGTIDGAVVGGSGLPHVESLGTTRFDIGAVGQTLWRERYVITVRAAAARQRHDHLFGDMRERDTHDTAFGEIAIRSNVRRHTWVAGAAIERDAYRPRDVPRFAYTFAAPGLFVQDDFDAAGWLSLSASGRVDFHNEYGTFVSPRVSALLRRGEWTSRLSAGAGFFPSTPLTEETEAAGLARLSVPRPLKAERGRSASLDVTRTAGAATLTGTLFASRVRDPARVDRTGDFALSNSAKPTRTAGVELLATWRAPPFAATGTYTFVRAREFDEERDVDVPLTPRHTVGLVAMWEAEDTGRIGFEFYYTGRQRLEENPFRAAGVPYSIVGVLAERRIGVLRLFVNGENLTGVRQTRWDPLVRPARASDGRWTVDSWAPLEGRVINGGVRLTF